MSGDGLTVERELQDYLHLHIPISSAMGVEVLEASEERVRLHAPLAPNINHRSTVFGGSAAAIGILSGWALLHVRLGHGGRVSRIVIQRNSIDYQHPIHHDFEAVASAPDTAVWDRFVRTLARRGRGRVELDVQLACRGEEMGRSRGTYVILPLDDADEQG